MNKSRHDWSGIEDLLDEIIEEQKKKLLEVGRQIVPTLTPEDVLQPNDYPELENHPIFRYEEGILAGTQSAQMALKAFKKDLESS
ncbi:MAG: hypothetical protein ACE5GN_03475 [Waddliaceae bacterium]